MLTYLIRRVLWMIPTMIGITVVIFLIMQAAPGGPETRLLGSGGAQTGMQSEAGGHETQIEKFRREFLLDQPLWRQYLHYVGPFNMADDGHTWWGGTGEKPWGGLVTGDLKTEFHRKSVKIEDELRERLKVTVPLALISVLLSYLIALPLGIHSVVRQGRLDDGFSTVVVFLLYSIPSFWAGLMLQLIFGANWLDWLPVIGLQDPDYESFTTGGKVWDWFSRRLLPITVLTYGTFAYLSRQMRAGMIDIIRQDYIRTARAKGLSEWVVVLKHALRNSMIPVITLFASALPILIGGSVIVEVIFQIQGMGRYAYEGLLNRDYNIVMATTTISAVMTLLGILVSDITYALVDPRISYD